jgi:hypothetical protein
MIGFAPTSDLLFSDRVAGHRSGSVVALPDHRLHEFEPDKIITSRMIHHLLSC